MEKKIIPYDNKAVKELKDIANFPILFVNFIFNNENKEIESVQYLEISSKDGKFKTNDLKTFMGNKELIEKIQNDFKIIYFETSPMKNKKIKMLFNQITKIKQEPLNFYKYIRDNFAIPVKSTEKDILKKIMEVMGIFVSTFESNDINFLNNLYKYIIMMND